VPQYRVRSDGYPGLRPIVRWTTLILVANNRPKAAGNCGQFVVRPFWPRKGEDLVSHAEDHAGTRRDFLYYATAGTGVVATGAAVWPLVNQMNPSADVRALARSWSMSAALKWARS
jgi:hypothetical protein